MRQEHHNGSKKVMLTLLLGGIVGAGALYCIQANQHRKTPVLKKIGRTISDVGEMLEHCNLSSVNGMVETIEKKIPKSMDIVHHLTDWVHTALTLWKKFQRG